MPNNTKKEECVPGEFILTSIPVQYRCRNCGKTWFSSEKTPECSAPQSPLSEERWCAKALDNLKEARLQGQRDERERLRQKAIEYKEKGFELETFIYSGFIEDLPTPPTEEVKD